MRNKSLIDAWQRGQNVALREADPFVGSTMNEASQFAQRAGFNAESQEHTAFVFGFMDAANAKKVLS